MGTRKATSASFRASAFVVGIVGALLLANCSSSSSSSGTPVECESKSANYCRCSSAPTATPNGTPCSASVFSSDGACFSDSGSKTCICTSFACLGSGEKTMCSFHPLMDSTPHVPLSACTGAHHCLDATTHYCTCQSTACSSNEQELSSCTDATAQSAIAATNGAQVDDCRATLSAPGTGGNTTNVCPSGPGRCSSGDNSTCRCGTSCVQTVVCVGCEYSCVKGCATDADCKGFFSSDANGATPQPLICVGGDSVHPTRYCGI